MYTVRFKPSAAASARKLPGRVPERALAKAEALGHDPHPAGSRRLVGTDLWRVRVVDYRIIYRIEEAVLPITVVRVGHRGQGVYDNLGGL